MYPTRAVLKLCLFDLALLTVPVFLFSMDAFARAGGGSNGSCKGFLCFLLLPVFFGIGLIVTWQIGRKSLKISAALREIAKREPAWSEDGLKRIVSDSFISIQAAWSAQDLATIEKLLHPGLYKSWEFDLQQQIRRNEKNIISDISINKIKFVDVQNYRNNEKDQFTVCIEATVDDRTYRDEKEIKKGDSGFSEFWTYQCIDGQWVLREITQIMGWRRFIQAPIIDEQ